MRKNLIKNHYIKKNNDFKTIFNEGNSCSIKGMKLFSLKNNFSYSRLGVSFCRNFAKAFIRNKEKRWIKELFRKYQHHLLPSYDYIFIIYHKAENFQAREMLFLNLLEIFELTKRTGINGKK